MDDLIAFISARLAEDEARATALLEAARHAIEKLKEPRLLGREIPGWHSWPDVEAMCLGTLRDIKAKRAILAEARRAVESIPLGHRYEFIAFMLRHLAAKWDDHPDWRDGWKPYETAVRRLEA